MSGYDPDERIHPPAPSFLSRPPSRAERRRFRRRLAALPPAPPLVFWPESIAIDGPWGGNVGANRRAIPRPRGEIAAHRLIPRRRPPRARGATGRHHGGA
jgi:hypothetical protein